MKKDLTGKRFGKLTALEETDQRQDGRVVWKCQCDCGNITYVPTNMLQKGHKKSCGCITAIDVTGQRFGKLVAIKPVGKNKYGYTQWLCQCDCGKEKIYNINILRSGKASSCGCIKKDTTQAEYRGKLSAKSQADKAIDGVRPTDFNKKKRSDNTSGYTGVYRRKGKWDAEIIVKGKVHRIGGFSTPEQAYLEGRLVLEAKYLPDGIKRKE